MDKTNIETKSLYVSRVVEEHKTNYVLRSQGKEMNASIRGKFHTDADFPKVGDFVRYSVVSEGEAVIEEILQRKTIISRDTAERSRKPDFQKSQILVTNVDIIFIVMGLDGDFNIQRLERYLVLATQSGIKPVIILNKSDVIDDKEKFEREVRSVAENVPIHFVSAIKGDGMEIFNKYLSPGITAVLLGSSGAGKSTITNLLLDDNRQSVGDVREDDSRGKHTTTSRELFDLKNGSYLIDTPGIRGLGIMGNTSSEENTFSDIRELQEKCRYPDCDHDKSEGCAIQEAMKNGDLNPKHFQSYLKIKKELEYKSAKADKELGSIHKIGVRKMQKKYNQIKDEKYDKAKDLAEEAEDKADDAVDAL